LAGNFKEAHDALRGKRRVDPAIEEGSLPLCLLSFSYHFLIKVTFFPV